MCIMETTKIRQAGLGHLKHSGVNLVQSIPHKQVQQQMSNLFYPPSVITPPLHWIKEFHQNKHHWNIRANTRAKNSQVSSLTRADYICKTFDRLSRTVSMDARLVRTLVKSRAIELAYMLKNNHPVLATRPDQRALDSSPRSLSHWIRAPARCHTETNKQRHTN